MGGAISYGNDENTGLSPTHGNILSKSLTIALSPFQRNKKSVVGRNEDAGLQNEVRVLRERVGSLELSNDELQKEVAKATLTIRDDDDEEVRKAKAIASVVAKEGLTDSTHTARDAKDKVFVALHKD